MSFAVIYVTISSQEAAQQLSHQLLKEKYIACANIFPISSAYWWAGAIENEGEWVALLKTTLRKWEQVKAKIEAIHPYDVPCILKIEVEANQAYEDWIAASVGPSASLSPP